MEKGVLKTLIKSLDTQLFDIVNNLICSICQELFYKPVTTPCGHSFCNRCIKRVLSSKDNSGCPLCKNPVKRYGLEADELKSTLTEICQELPGALEKDVLELTKNFADTEEIISTLKLSQIQNQENEKEIKNKRQRAVPKRKANKSKQTENDSETFIPVLKCTTKVLEYPSAKKKKMDDLVSVSQTGPASNSSVYDSSELFKKLEKIEKIPPEEKVSKWFSDVGDNIYINSPSSSILGGEIKPCSESEKREDDKPTMIRRDYIKCVVTSKNEGEICKPVDPYEFIPSQNKQVLKKNRQKSVGKKIPDFKAIQNFTKESIKRNTILLNDSKEEGVEEDRQNISNKRPITASQKFEELLTETKKEEKKTHVLYSASQSSSTQFLDVSFHSKTETVKKKKTPKVQKKVLDVEKVLFKNVELLAKEKGCRRSSRSKKSLKSPKTNRKEKLFSEIISMPNDEASELEKSVEKYLIRGHKDGESPVTKLGILLQELINDEVIYATRPANAPVRLPDLGVNLDDGTVKDITQNTGLIGFCTQEETSEEKVFKKMVENMEKELNSKEYFDRESEQKLDVELDPKLAEKNIKTDSPLSEGESQNCNSVKLNSEIPKAQFIKFLRLGRLTPVRGRNKSTVVKLVFPIGLSSLARRHAFENRCAPLPQVPRRPACQVSTGIQTSQPTNSCLVQTSQIPRLSVNLQTSQEIKPSVEVQTTQKWTASAEIQTSQRLVSQEINTTQIDRQPIPVQTTQLQGQLSPESISKILETPNRKPSLQHRKVIQRKNPSKSVLGSASPLSTPEKQSADKDLIMDFGTEKEPDESWWNNQKHEKLNELTKKRTKQNKEQNSKPENVRRKSLDVDSDDSDIQPFKRRGAFKILSQESARVLEKYEIRQLIPLDVRKISQDEEMEIINLATPGSQNSDEQMLKVLKNINLDLPKGRGSNIARGEKSEESDSDFFVEQTPPRPRSRAIDDIKSVSATRSNSPREIMESESHVKEASEGTDLIEDSLPKGFSESFLLLTAPHKTAISPDKNQKNETLKKTLKIEPTAPIDLPNENDQNKLNASEDKTKAAQLKAAIDAWKRTELPSPIKTTPPKKLCVVASSVKNSETIKKFVSRFKIEYLNKPMKHMTHLIVGLHENEDRELLPLCTPKLLFAMANKKWVVSELWAETCLKMDMIVSEENFETSDPVGGCGCRKARLSCEKLLKNCEIYLLGEFQMISKEDFADLIADCGGTLVPSPEKFSFIPTKLRMVIADKDCLNLSEKQLQELYEKHSTAVLSRDVIIMSIQSYNLVNLTPYLLHQASENDLVKLGYPLFLVRNEDDEDEDEEAYSRSVAR